MRFRQLVLISLALFSVVASSIAAENKPTEKGPSHPLDALTPDEITQTVKLLKAVGDAEEDTVYPALALKPALKEAVRAWKPGTPYTCTAFAVLRKGIVTYEAVVDLSNNKDEGLPAYVGQKRSINNEDLVVWYTMGFRHAPQPEDYPLLPTIWHELTLRPAFFFDRDPSMTFNPGTLPASGNSGTQQ